MRKKYIIEFEPEPFDRESDETFLWRASGFNALVFDKNGLDKLTPYDEEAIRKEAYKIGVDDAIKQFTANMEKPAREAYRKGLVDAWCAAHKVSICQNREKLFGSSDMEYIFRHFDVENAIGRLEAEQGEQEEKNTKWYIGDEIRNITGEYGNAIVTSIEDHGAYFRAWFMYKDGSMGICTSPETYWEKTGRSFPGVAKAVKGWMVEED